LREAIADAIDGISCPTCRPSGITAGRFGRPSSPTSCSNNDDPSQPGRTHPNLTDQEERC